MDFSIDGLTATFNGQRVGLKEPAAHGPRRGRDHVPTSFAPHFWPFHWLHYTLEAAHPVLYLPYSEPALFRRPLPERGVARVVLTLTVGSWTSRGKPMAQAPARFRVESEGEGWTVDAAGQVAVSFTRTLVRVPKVPLRADEARRVLPAGLFDRQGTVQAAPPLRLRFRPGRHTLEVRLLPAAAP